MAIVNAFRIMVRSVETQTCIGQEIFIVRSIKPNGGLQTASYNIKQGLQSSRMGRHGSIPVERQTQNNSRG
ncbi:12938_t:CDS:2, partial [Acaulospora colombiana]